jgi:hypothetical protein
MATSQQIEMAARAPRMQATPWGLSHSDEERERAITAIPKEGGYEAVARRERVKAALLLVIVGNEDLADALGISPEEIALARRVACQLDP